MATDKIKYATFAGDIVPARLLQIVTDETREQPNRNDATRTFKTRVREAQVVTLLPDGTLIMPIKNLAFVAPRFSTVEGLDVLDGSPIHPEKLTDMALTSQAERVGASSGTTVSAD